MKRLVFLSMLLVSATASKAILPLPILPTIQSQQVSARKTYQCWTPDEDKQLIQAVQRYSDERVRKWEQVANELKNFGITKTARQCRHRFNNTLKWEGGKVSGSWTQEEEYLLLEKYKDLGSRWAQIARFFPGRTPMNIKNRYIRLKKRKDSLSLPHIVPAVPPAQQFTPTIDNTPADNSVSSSDQTNSYFDDFNDVWWEEDDFFPGNNEF